MDNSLSESRPALRRLFFFPILPLLLTGCLANTTGLVLNKHVQLRKYKEVFIMAPKKDPEDVVPMIAAEFRRLGLAVKVVDPAKHPFAQGTGFFISRTGYILACAHEVGEEHGATIWSSRVRYAADVLYKDKDLDLAILKLKGSPPPGIVPVSFRTEMNYRLGGAAYTIGFPLSDILGDSPRLTEGFVSATTGLKDDPNHLQISTPIQPGNSGGPLFDSQGRVIGVVQETLNPANVYIRNGALPQNVNFAIKSDVALEYIRKCDANLYGELCRDKKFSMNQAEKSVVKIRAGIIPKAEEKIPKLIATLAYSGSWHQFRYFIIALYDFNSHRQILIAGQRPGAQLSDEDSVIGLTFIRIAKALNINR